MISAEAAHIPETRPDLNPLFKVLWIHKTPIGPRGADTDMPIKIPFIMKNISKVFFIINTKKLKISGF